VSVVTQMAKRLRACMKTRVIEFSGGAQSCRYGAASATRAPGPRFAARCPAARCVQRSESAGGQARVVVAARRRSAAHVAAALPSRAKTRLYA